jgi:hypothetical protein
VLRRCQVLVQLAQCSVSTLPDHYYTITDSNKLTKMRAAAQRVSLWAGFPGQKAAYRLGKVLRLLLALKRKIKAAYRLGKVLRLLLALKRKISGPPLCPYSGSRGGGQQSAQCNLSILWVGWTMQQQRKQGFCSPFAHHRPQALSA